jgi:hypothetical protein
MTGDYVVMMAVAQSLVHCKAADVLDMAGCMAFSYVEDAPDHWYSPYNKLMLEGLAAGNSTSYDMLATQACCVHGLTWLSS